MTDSSSPHTEDRQPRDWVQKIRRWVFREYPQGMPTNEGTALLHVLKPHFSESDIASVVRAIIHDYRDHLQTLTVESVVMEENDHPLLKLPDDQIEEYVRDVLQKEPDSTVVKRVLDRLLDPRQVAAEIGDTKQPPDTGQ